MKPALFLLAGLLAALLSFTLFGSISFLSIIVVYSFVLYRLFFYPQSPHTFLFLIGFTIGLEVWGIARFGQPTAFALFIWLLQYFFALRLRFTSLSLRYIVAMLLMYIGYNLIFFSPVSLSAFAERAISLLLTALLVGLFSIYFRSRSQSIPYELI